MEAKAHLIQKIVEANRQWLVIVPPLGDGDSLRLMAQLMLSSFVHRLVRKTRVFHSRPLQSCRCNHIGAVARAEGVLRCYKKPASRKCPCTEKDGNLPHFICQKHRGYRSCRKADVHQSSQPGLGLGIARTEFCIRIFP